MMILVKLEKHYKIMSKEMIRIKEYKIWSN